MKRMLLAVMLLAGSAACEPEYAPAASEEHLEPVVGGADPTAVSGGAAVDSSTIHHPGADGNAGRPADGRGS
jgi:hypothetical protein